VKHKSYSQFQTIGKETLPILLKPLPDELLSSWIMRYAKSLYTKSHTFCKFILSTENVWNRDIDLNVSDQFIAALSSKTVQSYDNVFKTTLKSYHPNLFVDVQRKWIIPLGIYHRTRSRAGLMLCPGCLQKDEIPYYRKKWRLSLSVVCPDCGVYLIEECPKCKSPIIFHRLEVGFKEAILNKEICTCYKCAFDFRKWKPKKAEKSIIEIQQHFYTVLEKGHTENLQYSHLYFDVAHQLAKIIDSSSPKLQPFDSELSKRSKIKNSKNPGGEFDKKELEDRILIIKKIHWLLQDWPERLLSISKETRTFSSYLLRDMKEIPYWYWKVVMENAYVVYTTWRPTSKYSYLPSYKVYGIKQINSS
jgi:hypothetical protein